MIKRLVSVAAALLALAGCFSTSTGPTAGGGSGSEIEGKAAYRDSTVAALGLGKSGRAMDIPVVGGNVFIYAKSLFPDTNYARNPAVPAVRTGSDGSFRISHVPGGLYVLEVNDGSGKSVARDVTVPSESTLVNVGTLYLGRCGSIQTKIEFPSLTQVPVHYYLGLRGTRFLVEGTAAGVDLTIGSVATGVTYVLTVELVAPFHDYADVANVTVTEGVTTVLQTIQVNPTPVQ
jgi:hypothetical protein